MYTCNIIQYIYISFCLSHENIYLHMGPWAIFLPHEMGQRERFWSKNHEARIAIFFDFLSNLQQVLTCIIYYIYIFIHIMLYYIYIHIYVFRRLKIMSLFFCGGDHVHFISAGSFSHVPRLRRRQFRPRKAGRPSTDGLDGNIVAAPFRTSRLIEASPCSSH